MSQSLEKCTWQNNKSSSKYFNAKLLLVYSLKPSEDKFWNRWYPGYKFTRLQHFFESRLDTGLQSGGNVHPRT